MISDDMARRLELIHAWRSVHYAQAYQALHPDENVEIKSINGGYAIYSGQGSPLNSVSGLGFQGPVEHSDLESVESFYESHGQPSSIDLCPFAHPSLSELLEGRGYHPDMEFNVLFCRLPQDVGEAIRSKTITIEQVGSEDAEVWIRTVGQGFESRDRPSQETLDMMAPNFHSAIATCFLARIDGEPTGGGGMYIHDGVAEFGGTSTRVQFRRRGVQSLLLSTRLEGAASLGCDLAMIMTTPDSHSQSNIERAGFKLAYTKTIMTR